MSSGGFPAGVPPVLRRLELQLREALAEGSEVHEVAGFRVHVWRTPDPFYRNVAVPVRPSVATDAAAVPALRAAFARHRRRARVEFFAELWPGLDLVLEEAGFAVEARAPVMAATGPADLPAAAEVTLLDGAAPPPLLRAGLEGAAAAFHEPAAMLAPGELERLQAGLAAGTLRSALVLVDGAPVGGASLAGRGPVAELLGVWTHPGHRRRGLARTLCRRLLADFFAAGGEVAWLTAGTRASARLYAQLGFLTCGTHLDCADGAAGPPDS